MDSQMQNPTAQLSRLLQTYLSSQNDDRMTTLAARNLALCSDSAHFIDSALTLISTPLSPHKLTLLSCMLKDKFKYDFELLDPQRLNSYYNELCQAAAHLGTDNKSLVNNLAHALALIYINAVSLADLSLKQYLEPLIPQHSAQLPLYNYYFKVLEFTASELDNDRVVVDANSRSSAKQRMVDQQASVLQILNASVDDVWHNPQVSPQVSKRRIMDCFSAWIQLSSSPTILNSLHQTPLLRVSIAALRQQQQSCVQSAVQCIKTVIQSLKTPEQNPEMYLHLGRQMAALTDLIELRLASHDTELAQLLISVVVYFSRKFVDVLVSSFSSSTRAFLLNLVKYLYTGIEALVQPQLQFWQMLLSRTVQAKERGSLSPEFKLDMPVTLLHALVQLCQYPNHLINQLQVIYEHKLSSHHQEAETIYFSRLNTGKCFDLIAQLMGTNAYVNYLVQTIAHLQPKNDKFWGELDAYLLSLASPLKRLESVTDHAVLLVNTYQQLTNQHKPCPLLLRRTFLRVFKSLFSIKIKDIDLVKKLLFLTSECFETPLLLESAQRTFYRGCEQNSSLLYYCLDEMVQVVKSYPTEEYIVRGVIALACLHPDTAHFYIENSLRTVLLSASDERSTTFRKKECLQSLTAAVKELRDHPFPERDQLLTSFTREAWTFIINTLKKPQSRAQDEDNLVQRAVKLLKSIMRTLGLKFSQFLIDLFRNVNQCFAQYPICSYIYLIEVAVTVFSKYSNPHLNSFLAGIYNEFSELAFQHLQTPQSIQNYSFLVDDFLGMNSRLVLYNTEIVVNSRHFSQLLQFAASDCLLATSPRVLKASYSFLQTLFMLFWPGQFIEDYNQDAEEDEQFQPKVEDATLHTQLRTFLLAQLDNLLQQMLQHLAEVPAEITREQIMDSFLSEIKAFPRENVEIWQRVLAALSPNVLLQTEKQRVVELIAETYALLEHGHTAKRPLTDIAKLLDLMNKRIIAVEKRRQLKHDHK